MNQKLNEYTQIDDPSEFSKTLHISMIGKKFIDRNGYKYVVKIAKEGDKRLELVRLSTKSEIEAIKNNEKLKKKSSSTNSSISVPKQMSILEDYDLDINDPAIESLENFKPIIASSKPKLKSDMEEIEEKLKAPPSQEKDLHLGEIDLNINDTHDSRFYIKSDINYIIPRNVEEETQLIDQLFKGAEKNKERINSIMTNLKNSRFFDLVGDPSDNKNILGNFIRDYELEVFKIIKDSENKLKEFRGFPKPINYYASTYAKQQKDVLNRLSSDKEKYDHILRWEMQSSFSFILRKFNHLTTELLSLLNSKKDNELKLLNQGQLTLFKDSKLGLVNCLQNLDTIRRAIEKWRTLDIR